jgi:ABC-type nitrate/sulfonate/bicarbonate transport system substrate-binding protein
MKQRGFLLAGPMLWAAVAAGTLILGLTVALKVQSARLDAAKAHLEACETRYGEALEAIRKQNEAVKELEKASKEATERALKAKEKAEKEIARMKPERDRLAELVKKGFKGQCPAGEAVKKIREGF